MAPPNIVDVVNAHSRHLERLDKALQELTRQIDALKREHAGLRSAPPPPAPRPAREEKMSRFDPLFATEESDAEFEEVGDAEA